MDILTKLGIDYTLFYQLAVFFIAYVALTRLLFKPYMNAYHKRIEATFGNQDVAEKLIKQAEDLHVEYEEKAREVNLRVQSYFEQAHKEALAVQAEALEKARAEAEGLLDVSRREIHVEVERAQKALPALIPDLSREIEKKILNRELS